MTACRNVREDLTAWIDGQLPARRRDQVRQHLAACAPCNAEMASLRVAVAWQQDALRAVSAESVDAGALKVQLRRALAARTVERRRGWSLGDVWASMWGRLALAGAAVSVAGITLLLVGGPGMVLMPLGLEPPPRAVVQQTELFKDYPMIERLDVLEHFDTVESVPLDDDSASQHG